MAFVNGGAVVSCGNVAIGPTSGSMLLGSPAGGTVINLGPVRITGNLVKPVTIKTVRAISSTRIRVEFSRAVLNNIGLADPANYAVKGINSGADVAITGIDVPNGTTVTTVDILVSEMTAWDFIYPATYLVSINSSSIVLGPQLVADWDMEKPASLDWVQHLSTTVNKVAGAPSGAGARVIEFNGGVPTLAGVKQPNLFAIGAYYRFSAYWRNSNFVAKPCIAFSDNVLPNTGNPTTFGQAFLLGTQFDTAFRYVQVDIAAAQTGLFIGRDGNGAPSSAQFDEVSARRWLGSGGGTTEVTDAQGVAVVSDPFGFLGVGIAPKIRVAYATDKNTIVVQFTERILDLGSIRTVGAYTANLGLTIQAILDVEVDTVTLKTSNQTAGQLYTLTLTGTWYDASLNPLVSPSNTPVLGFVAPAVTEALLTLNMYNFLIAGIRDADQTEQGAKFIERFVQGPQTIWAAIVKTIFDIPKIWSASDCPDELLQFLKRIVGWTPDTDSITEALDFATLRQLIAASVAFWKTRGPESSVEDLLRITTASRSYVQNWFQLRFLLDEVYLGEEHGTGTDPWLLSVPGEGDPDAWTYNIRIVDDGSLDRQLVRDVAKLTRPVGERVLITYLGFLDRFETDGDLTQWSFPNTTGITHTAVGGALHFQYNGSNSEYAFVNSDAAQSWSSYVVSWTFKTSFNQTEFIFYGTGDPNVNNGLIDYYFVRLYFERDLTLPNQITLAKRVAGVASTLVLTNFLTNFGERLLADVTYTLRVEVCPITPSSSSNSINVYIDGVLVLSTTDSVFSQGTIGLNVRTDQGPTLTTFDLLELEMFYLPRSFDFIDLGNVVNNDVVDRGPELMADPDFDDPAAWTLSAGMSIHDGYLEVDPGFGNGRLALQLVPWELGDKFEFKFTISNWVADTAIARISVFGAITDNNGAISASGNGDYTITVSCDVAPINSSKWLALRFGDLGDMRIERLSVKKILFPTG